MNYANPLNLKVVSLKTWNTDDGGGYQCFLEHNGVKAIEVHNDGNGGEIQVRAINIKHQSVLNELSAFVKRLPAEDFEGTMLDISLDMYVDELVSDAENNKRFTAMVARNKKKAFVFRLPEDGVHELRTIKCTPAQHPQAVALLDKKYGAGKWAAL